MKKIYFVILSSISLFSCGEKVYTVEELKVNSSLRYEILDKCSNGELKYNDQNCINAKSVVKRIISD